MTQDIWQGCGLHGHECPGLAIGAAMRREGDPGRYFWTNMRWCLHQENDACGVDAIQHRAVHAR